MVMRGQCRCGHKFDTVCSYEFLALGFAPRRKSSCAQSVLQRRQLQASVTNEAESEKDKNKPVHQWCVAVCINRIHVGACGE